MLHDLSWLEPGLSFPPLKERDRIDRYKNNELLFDGEHFSPGCLSANYKRASARVQRVIGNFEDVISFNTLLNYQRLMSLKMADLVCGEYPIITGTDKDDNAKIKETRDYTDFDSKLYSIVIDMSRYGDAVIRYYLDNDGEKTFTCWSPIEWYPIVSQDGTNTILKHVLCWRENRGKDGDMTQASWYLHCQIHSTDSKEVGQYEYRVYKLDSFGGQIKQLNSKKIVKTGLDVCAVQHLKSYSTTSTVYGYDDYMIIDSILAEIMTRIGQISVILDKHADPNITGPVSMLTFDEKSGEYKLKTGKFFAVSPGEEKPEYMTWEGQLESAFAEIELLINQLYILSEMGAALLGGDSSKAGGGGNAISGTAFRFKMANPLSKARRISNSLTRPVRKLFSILGDGLEFKNISVFWQDGLPDDPRENIETAKLATGATALMPLETAIVEFFSRSNEEALEWIDKINKQKEEALALQQQQTNTGEPDPNKPGPQDGKGVNPRKKGSQTGLNNFHGLNNK